MIPRALTPAAFAARDPGANILTFSGESMGTSWSLQAVSPPPDAAEGVQAALDRVVAQMSQWETGSDLSRFNRAAPGSWQAIPTEFAEVIAAALEISAASGGAFDPGLGSLTERWGFGASGSTDRVPDAEHVLAADRRIDFEPSPPRIRRSGDAALDLAGIAKGYGVDLAAVYLLGAGVRHFLIEVGGELRGEGIRPDGQPWWVDLEVPPASSVAPYRIALHDLSVATSGNYRRGFEANGVRYSHSFDPRTGRPVTNDIASVTILHRSCMMADGWATALTVLGPDVAMALADDQRLAACIIAGNGEHLSRAWREMLA